MISQTAVVGAPDEDLANDGLLVAYVLQFNFNIELRVVLLLVLRDVKLVSDDEIA